MCTEVPSASAALKLKRILLHFSKCYLQRCVAPNKGRELLLHLREFLEEEPVKTLLV